jgi:putative RecB family exonuclease
MTIYSHSRVSTFENCPYQYKLHYIDKVEVETPTTIEPFMGDIVHQSLEDLYKRKKFKQRISKETLIKFYRDLWDKEYSEDIRIVKEGLDAKNYKKMGEKFLSDYYDRMKPFEQITILGLETQDRMTLPDGNQWHVRIDKLGCDDKGNYYVCDYKTNSRMKDQEETDSDRQIAMYSIWVKDKFKDAKSVKLIWHMLAFNKDAVSERTEKQLKELQEEVINLIKEIETATKDNNFPRKQSALCDYCVYKEICPSFKHEVELEKIEDVKEFKENEGVKLVDEFSEIKNKLQELTKRQVEFGGSLIDYAKQFGVDIVYGSNMKASVKEIEKIIMPEDEKEKTKFIQLLKDKGLWEEFSMICYPKINSKVLKGEMDKEIRNKIEIGKDFRINLSKRKDIEDDE